MYRLPSVIHDIPSSFDLHPPQALNRGLTFKLKAYGVEDNPLKILRTSLISHKQRVVLKDRSFSWKQIFRRFNKVLF